MAEEFKELIEQLQTNNKEEAQRDIIWMIYKL